MYPADLASEDQCGNKSNSNGHGWLYGRPEDISHGYQRAVFYPQNHRHEREHHRDVETTASRHITPNKFSSAKTSIPTAKHHVDSDRFFRHDPAKARARLNAAAAKANIVFGLTT